MNSNFLFITASILLSHRSRSNNDESAMEAAIIPFVPKPPETLEGRASVEIK